MAEPEPTTPRKKRDVLSVLGMVAVAGAAAFTSYAGLDRLALMADWPGKLALMLPVTIDAYAMTATRVWLSPARLTKKARAWAKGNAIGAIATSVTGNMLYHAAAAHVISVTWPVVVGISAIPSIVLGLTVHLWHVSDDLEPEPEPKQSPGPAIAEPETVRAAYPILGTTAVSAGRSLTSTPRTDTATTTASDTRGAGTKAATTTPRRSAEPVSKQGKTQRDAELLIRACELNDQARAAGKGSVGVRQLMRELHVGQGKAYELLDRMSTPPGARVTVPSEPDPRPAQPLPVGRTSTGSATVPDTYRSAAPNTPGSADPVSPTGVSTNALPTQREAPLEHANGASVDAS